MENFNLSQAKDVKDVTDIADIVKKIAALQRQLNNLTRDGMINALMDAKFTAGAEIQKIEYSQGEHDPNAVGELFKPRFVSKAISIPG